MQDSQQVAVTSPEDIGRLTRTDLLQAYYDGQIDLDLLVETITKEDDTRASKVKDWFLFLVGSVFPGVRPGPRY